MQPEIHLASAADAEALAELRYQLCPDCAPDSQRIEIAQLLAGEGIVALARTSGPPVGFAEVSLRSDHVEGATSNPVPYLEGWYVRPDFRRRGIGGSLLRFVESWAGQRGFRELASDTEIGNLASIRLHRALGFREAERTVHFIKTLRPEQS